MLEESEAYLNALRRSSRRRSLGSIAVLTAVLFCVGTATFAALNHTTIEAFQRGERTLTGDRHFEPEFPAQVDDVDLARVHEHLLPAWAIALAHVEDRWSDEDRAYRDLQTAVSGDKNLSAIVAEFRQIGWRPDAANQLQRLEYLAWAWSDYLAKQGAPYALEADMMTLSSGDFLYFKAYRIVDLRQVNVGEHHFELELVSRLDQTNIRELYLGATHVEGVHARLMLDRIQEFTDEQVLPLFDSRHQTPLESQVYEGLRRALTHGDLLAIEAELRRRRVARDIEHAITQNPECADFALSEDTLEHFDLFRDVVFKLEVDGPSHLCTLSSEQHRELTQVNYWGGPAVGFASAHGNLVDLVTRAVGTHEARHMADADTGINCDDCGRLSAGAVIEVSAYTASLAWSPTPALVVLQACQVQHTKGPHGEAIRYLLPLLGASCSEVPDSLSEDAQRFERERFGRNDPISMQ